MKKILSAKLFLFISICLLISHTNGQTITPSVPGKIDTSKKYLFYLHGGIVQTLGANAVSKYYGRYEYQKILDTFKDRGFNVISEVRPKETEVSDYAEKLAGQVKMLKKRGVSDKNIIVVGASLGAYITIEAADKLKKKKVKFVLIGLCSEYAVKYYAKYRKKLRGNFLSIYEETDEKGSCRSLFKPKHRKAKFTEIRINMGNGHGFLYKPYDEWTEPLIKWIDQN